MKVGAANRSSFGLVHRRSFAAMVDNLRLNHERRLERETGIEPATSSLGIRTSTKSEPQTGLNTMICRRFLKE